MGLAVATPSIRSTETRTFNGDGCPLEWLFESIDRANPDDTQEKVKSFYLRGHVGHEMIEHWLNGGSTDECMQIMWDFAEDEELWAQDWVETTKCSKENIIYELMTIFTNFVKQYEEHYVGLELESTEFMLDFYTPQGTHVRTELDALFRNEEGRPVLVDWKLGTSRSGKPMQLFVYWYGLKQMGIVDDDDYMRAWFHYPQYSAPLVHITRYPGDAFVEEYIDTAEANRRSGVYLPNPQWVSCNYCSYQEWCPLYSSDPQSDWEWIRNVEVRFDAVTD